MKRVLLLEDVEANANLIRFSLERISGFDITHVPDGQAAVDCFKASAFDICLFDHLTPGMTGLDAMREIQALPGARDVPFVFLTARSDTNNWKQLREGGAAAVIAKPFDIMLLGSQLMDVYHAHEAQEAKLGAADTAGPDWAQLPSRSALARRPVAEYQRF